MGLKSGQFWMPDVNYSGNIRPIGTLGVTNTGALVEASMVFKTSLNSPYLALSTDRHIYVNAAGGAVIVLLSPATGSGRIITIKRMDNVLANAVTVTADVTGTPDTIDGAATAPLSMQWVTVRLHDAAADAWYIV